MNRPKPHLEPVTPREARRLIAAAIALLRGSGPTARAVARALARVALSRYSPAEREWLERIAQERSALARSQERIEIDLADYAEHDISPVRIAPTVAQAVARNAIDPVRGRALFKLVVDLRAERCLELGTNLGVSASYLAAGLEVLATGRLVSIDLLAPVIEHARRHHDRLGLGRVDFRVGRFSDLIDGALTDLGGVDLAFVDGDHREEPTVGYFDRIHAAMDRGGVVAFDNIAWSEEMERAWSTIAADRRVRATTTVGALGLAIVG